MKIHIELPHGKLEIEYEPIAPYKFYTLCWCITICVVATAFFGIFK